MSLCFTVITHIMSRSAPRYFPYYLIFLSYPLSEPRYVVGSAAACMDGMTLRFSAPCNSSVSKRDHDSPEDLTWSTLHDRYATRVHLKLMTHSMSLIPVMPCRRGRLTSTVRGRWFNSPIRKITTTPEGKQQRALYTLNMDRTRHSNPSRVPL